MKDDIHWGQLQNTAHTLWSYIKTALTQTTNPNARPRVRKQHLNSSLAAAW